MTRSQKTPTAPRYILLTEDRCSHGYYHLYGRIVTQRYVGGRYEPDSVDDTYRSDTLYSGLQLRCQGDHDSRRRALDGDRAEGPVYGFSCEYADVYHVDRRRAVRMAKTLTTLEAKLDKLREQRGSVRTYGEYVGRVAEALGCVGVAYVRSRFGEEVTGERFQWGTVGDGVSQADRLTAAWMEEARPKPAQAAYQADGQEVA